MECVGSTQRNNHSVERPSDLLHHNVQWESDRAALCSDRSPLEWSHSEAEPAVSTKGWQRGAGWALIGLTVPLGMSARSGVLTSDVGMLCHPGIISSWLSPRSNCCKSMWIMTSEMICWGLRVMCGPRFLEPEKSKQEKSSVYRAIYCTDHTVSQRNTCIKIKRLNF